MGSNPEAGITFFHTEFFFQRWMYQLFYQIMPPCTFCLVSHLTLSSFLTLSSSILRQKLHLFPIQNYIKGPGNGYKALNRPNLGTQCINPLFVFTSSRPGPHCIYIFNELDRQYLVEWSVGYPTWLPSSNREASLCRNEWLEDQLKESG